MVTHDDEGPRRASGARKRPAKKPRTSGIGRTGARFPAAQEPDPEADDVTDGGQDGAADSGRDRAADGGLDRADSWADTPDEGSADLPAEGPAQAASEVGYTGARFGPRSVRKSKRPKQSRTDDDHGRQPAPDIPAPSPPPSAESARGSGEPTPLQSAERTHPMIKPWSGALVRPYAHTGGRTRSSHDLALEALISSSRQIGAGAAALTTHHRRRIVDLCAQPRSVAEVAALLSVPLGVARVLLGDLATAGAVVVHPTASTIGDGEPDVEFMNRVLAGLRRL